MYHLNAETLFPPSIDSQVYTSWLTCKRKFANRYLYHMQTQYESTDLIAGASLAAAMEAARTDFYLHGKSQEEAIFSAMRAAILEYGDHVPQKPEKTIKRVLDAVVAYFDHFPLGMDDLEPVILADGHPAVEAKFRIPLGIMHPETGKELCYTGTMDFVATKYRQVFPVDEKTTGGGFTQAWEQQWHLRNQFLGYLWALRQAQITGHGAIVRGITFPKKVDPDEVANHQFIELMIPIAPQVVDYWERQMRQEVQSMLASYAELKAGSPTFQLSFGVNCNDYNRKCEFMDACTTSNPDVAIAQKFDQLVWMSDRRENVSLVEVKQQLKLA